MRISALSMQGVNSTSIYGMCVMKYLSIFCQLTQISRRHTTKFTVVSTKRNCSINIDILGANDEKDDVI